MKNSVIVVLSIILVVGLLFMVYKFGNNPAPLIYKEAQTVKPTDHLKWSKDKKNLLVEYSDFQCPACKAFNDELRKIESTESADFKITQKITFVYRHFPLSQHPNAKLAAYASEAGAKQNKFYEITDLLFDTQTEWAELKNPKDFFVNLAKKLDLDIDKYEKDIDSDVVKAKVQEDFLSGEKVDIRATPTFFLNGKKVEVRSMDEFKKLLLSTVL